MAPDGSNADSPLEDLRRRGQFLFGVLLWASAAGFLIVVCSGALVTYHYAISLAERLRSGLGFAPPLHGPDWFLLLALSSGPLVALVVLLSFSGWYRRLWVRRVALVWPEVRDRRRFSPWRRIPFHADNESRLDRGEYIAALLESPGWRDRHRASGQEESSASAEWLLQELEK